MNIIAKSVDLMADDLDKINKFTNRNFTAAELYTFSIILCDNEVDRDLERFDNAALNDLSQLFIGKTGIFDHNVSGKNQTARIYSAEIVTDSEKLTSLGEHYNYVKAKAYMVKSSKSNDLMLEIEGGIKKEVSVSCSIKSTFCSVCGADQRVQPCSHKKGKTYNKQQCHHILSTVTDAYEWSFVAVPAQKNAGVTKGYSKKEAGMLSYMDYQALTNALGECDNDGIFLTKHEAGLICNRLDELENLAIGGNDYRNDLISEVKRLSFLNNEDIPKKVFNSVTEKMDITELKAFKMSYENRLNQAQVPQLSGEHLNTQNSAAFKL